MYERPLHPDIERPRIPRPQRVFYVYAPGDEALRARLEVHLSVLTREGLIEPWHGGKISPGAEWGAEIRRHLDRADIVLFLMTADLLASSQAWELEMRRAIERHEAGDARVIPVILRPCDWRSTPLGKFQAVPKEAIPVTRWADQEDGWVDVAQRIRKLVSGDNVRPRHLG